MSKDESDFERIMADDRRAERRIARGEIILLLALALGLLLYWHLRA